MARLQEDVRRLRFWRSIIAEFVGSLFVVLIGCGAYTETVTVNADPTNSWLAVRVALAFGLSMTAVLYCVRNVTDAHINPSVTVALLVTRRASVIRSLLYLVAQFIGAIVGAGLLLAVTASEYRTNRTWPGGCTVPAEHVTEGQAFGVEFFATFFFAFIVVSCYDKVKSDMKSLAPPFIIGLTYAAVILFSLPYTGGSINTARSFGPAIVNVVWRDHWVYWFGPIIGGVCGGAVYDVIFSTKSSFQRITACFTVFHVKPHDDAAGADQALRDKDPEYQSAAEVSTVAGTTSCAVDEMDELAESKGDGDHPGAADEQKPRLKLFARPKFSCCSSAKETGQ